MFDVDSTLIAHEAIEEIADVLGKREVVAEITSRAMRGEIDFEQSLRERVSLLRGVSEASLLGISKNFRVNDGAQQLIDHVHALGGKACAVSGGFENLLEPIASKLGLDAYLANRLEVVNGELTGELLPPIVDAQTKRAALTNWSQQFSISMDKTVAIGDGANDLLMMEAAAVSIGFQPKPIVAEHCDHVLEIADFSPVIGLLP